MKTYKFLIAIILSALVTSCADDLLDRFPEDTLSPETYFKQSSELELWLNRCYSMFDDLTDVAATNADDDIDNTPGDLIMGQRLPSTESGWNWQMLRHINFYLQNSGNCEDASAKKQYDGVARFFRAYFYFVKVRRYGDVPWYNQVLNSEDDELLYKARDDRGLVMDSVMADLDKAIELLPTKKDQLHVTKWTALAFKSRAALYEGTFRKYHGLGNSEKYLQQSADAAYNFIKNGGYKLYTKGTTPYRDMFNSDDAVSEEVILTRIYSAAAKVFNSAQFNISNDKLGFTRRFMNHYLMNDGTRFIDQEGWETMQFVEETKNRDPRMAQTVLTPGYIQVGSSSSTVNTLTSLTGYQPIKYVASSAYGGSNKGVCDYPLFRAAEVMLNYAEAKAELGTLTQNDLDISINVIRSRAGMPNLSLSDANANPDALLLTYYPNVTKGSNTGVILEIRRERTVEMPMEGLRHWDILRWKEGKQFTNKFYGCYFPGEGEYDMDGDGTADVKLYSTSKGSFSGSSYKIGTDIVLSEGTKGYVVALPKISLSWDETRDYLWPIPASERVLTGGILSQNPGWDDGLSF